MEYDGKFYVDDQVYFSPSSSNIDNLLSLSLFKECRKQTNKKSLCITHYKEEYESNHRSSSWSNNLSSFQLPSYQQLDDQNNTISTTDKTEQRSFHDGYIKYMHSGRRFILKNSKWQPLCKYDDICRNMAKYESLCIKHYELTTQKKQRDNQRLHTSVFNKYFSTADRNKQNGNENWNLQKSIGIIRLDFSVSSSSITEQFDINSTENSCSVCLIRISKIKIYFFVLAN